MAGKGNGQQVAEAVWRSTQQRGRGSQRTSRDGRRLVLMTEPMVTAGGAGLVCQVRLYDAASGTEIPVDPVRQLVHPPLHHDGRKDPLGAFWSALWDSVRTNPNPTDWFPA